MSIRIGVNQELMDLEGVASDGGRGAGELACLGSLEVEGALPFGFLCWDFAVALVRAFAYRAEETGGRLELDW